DINAVIKQAQASWDELVALSSKVESTDPVVNKWAELLEAKHRRLTELSKELDRSEQSYQWSRTLCARELEHLKSMGIATQSHEGHFHPPTDDAAARASSLKDLAQATLCGETLGYEVEFASLRKKQARELKELRSQVAEVVQTRETVRDKQHEDLADLYSRLKEAGVKLGKADIPDPVRPEDAFAQQAVFARPEGNRRGVQPGDAGRLSLVCSRA
ncbi:unnamed protein product, partial [Polarella glacialis]